MATMDDANETTIIGRSSRRDEVTLNDQPVWRNLLLSLAFDSSKSNEESLVQGSLYDGIEDNDWDENSGQEDQDVGYGSIQKCKRKSCGHGESNPFLDSDISAQNEPRDGSSIQPLSPTNNSNLSLTHSFEIDPENSADSYNKLSRSKKQRFSVFVWMAIVVLSCSSMGIFGTHMPQGIQDLSQIFIFDTLFSQVKKSPSRRDLERPPPLARSLLLVLRAEVTPENPMVKDMDRMLTAKGMRDAEGLGVYLQQHHIPGPDWIFSSPSERTAFTTELMRRHWGSEAPVAFEDILYTLEFNDYFNFVAGLNDQFRRVMIVGENPAIYNTARKLMKTHGIEDFPDCGFMEIRWNDLCHWNDVEPFSGESTMAIDPHNNFFFSLK